MSDKPCLSCGVLNPSDHLFCEGCGFNLSDSDIAPVYINTLKHDSVLITIDLFYRRIFYFVLATLLGVGAEWIWHDHQITAGVLALAWFIAWYIPHAFHRAITQPIPTEILSKNIIAYGPASKSGLFIVSFGMFYFLDDGFFFKSYSFLGHAYFLFIEKSNIDSVSGLEQLPLGQSSSKICITLKGGVEHRLSVYKRTQWLMLMYSHGIDVLIEGLRFTKY